jgi:hypothetical protein
VIASIGCVRAGVRLGWEADASKTDVEQLCQLRLRTAVLRPPVLHTSAPLAQILVDILRPEHDHCDERATGAAPVHRWRRRPRPVHSCPPGTAYGACERSAGVQRPPEARAVGAFRLDGRNEYWRV